MSKVKSLFEIDKYDLLEDKIIVEIFRKGKEETVTIPRQEYEKWLADSGRLDWVNDWADYSGEHQQATGTLPIDIYWEDIQDNDIYDWIVINWIAEGVFDIEQPMENILGTISSPEKIAL